MIINLEVLKVQTANGQNNETTNNLTGSIKSTDQFINDLGRIALFIINTKVSYFIYSFNFKEHN